MTDSIILFASSRREGNTGKLTDTIAQQLGVEIVDLTTLDISPFDYDHNNRNDDFEPLMNRLFTYQNILFATPIYWYSVAPDMKIFLDRISDYLSISELLDDGRKLRGKTGYVICSSISEEPDQPFVDAFEATFAYLGMGYGGCINANCAEDYNAQTNESQIAEFIQRLSVGK
ncbi:MAG: multimeric flavodoxin WrbA [Saprospiraceae bacterium]|jgi:multimeric flavodoxin WrbA